MLKCIISVEILILSSMKQSRCSSLYILGLIYCYSSVKDVTYKETILWVWDNLLSVWKLYLPMIFNWQSRPPLIISQTTFSDVFQKNYMITKCYKTDTKMNSITDLKFMWYHLLMSPMINKVFYCSLHCW